METTTEGSNSSKFPIPDVLFWLVIIILGVLLLYLLVGLYFVYHVVADGLERRRMRRVGAVRLDLTQDAEFGSNQTNGGTSSAPARSNEEKTKRSKMVKFKNEISTSLESSHNAIKKTMKKIYGSEGKETPSSVNDENENPTADVNCNLPKSGEIFANNNSILVYAANVDDDPDEDYTEYGDDETEAPTEFETPYQEGEEEAQGEIIPENFDEIDQNMEESGLVDEEAEEDAIMNDDIISREPTSSERVNEDGFLVINPSTVLPPTNDDELPLVEETPEEVSEEVPKEVSEEECDPDDVPEKRAAGALSLLEFAQTEGGWNRQKVTNPEAENKLTGIPHCHPSERPGRHFTLAPYLQPLQDFVISLAISAPQSESSMIIQNDGNANPVPVVFDTEDFDDNDQTAIRDEMDRLTRERSCGTLTLLDFIQAEGSDWKYQDGTEERPDPTKKKRRKCSEIAKEKMMSGQHQTQTIYMAETSGNQGSGIRGRPNEKAAEESDRRRPQKSNPEVQDEVVPPNNFGDEYENEEYENEEYENEEYENEEYENQVVESGIVDESLISESNVEVSEMVNPEYPEESVQEVPEDIESVVAKPCTDEVTINANEAGTTTSVVQPCGGPATITINLNIQTGQCADGSPYKSGKKSGFNDNITRATEGAYPDCEPCDRLFAENRTPYPVVREIGSDFSQTGKDPRYCGCNPAFSKPQFNEEENLEMCKSFGAMTLLDYMQAEGSAYGHTHHKHGESQNSNFDRVRTQIASWWDSAKNVAGIKTSDNPEFSADLLDECDPNPADESDVFQRVSKTKSDERRKSEKEYEELRRKSKIESSGPIENEYTKQVVKMSEEEGRKISRTQGHDEQVRSNYERDLNARSGEQR